MEHKMETAGELAKWAAQFPPNYKVLVQSDAEGNDVHYLFSGEEVMLDMEDPDEIGVYNTPEELERLIASGGGWTEDAAAPEGAVRAIILVPGD